MAYNPPIFNLVCDVYKSDPTNDFLLKTFRLSSPCQLRGYGRLEKPQLTPFGLTSGLIVEHAALLLPRLTDVRDMSSNASAIGDTVEVPAGSGRWYLVALVDDVAKGFTNEYRFASITKAYQGGFCVNFPLWPSPIP